MNYKVTRVNESRNYDAAGHYDVRTTRLHDADEVAGLVTLGLSHFLPGGGAEMAKAAKELIYYIIEGEMTVFTGDERQHVLRAGDSIHFPPYLERGCKNTGISAAKMLVIACPPKSE